MSRAYSMQITVSKFKVNRTQSILETCMNNWNFDELSESRLNKDCLILNGQGEGCLCGGESEDAFVSRISRAVWEANGAVCNVEIIATYLEDLPYTIHTRGETEYKAWKKKIRQLEK